MEFHKNSALVRIWADLIYKKAYRMEQVPKIGNLQEIVNQVLKERGE